MDFSVMMKHLMMSSVFDRKVVAVLMCVVATCLFSACKDSDSKDEPAGDAAYAQSRTVLVYVVAENSLNGQLYSDVNEMLAGMKTEGLWQNDRLVLYVDDTQSPRFYVIDRNTQETTLSAMTPVKTYDEDLNSSSPDQLAAALDFVQSKYPATSYGLVLWSHASGWIPSTYAGDAASKARRSFGIDNGQNSSSSSLPGHQMNIADIARVVEQKGGVDFVFFDACFMQSVEVAYELRKATQHVIGSPAEIPGPGAYYQTMVPAMFKASGYADAMLRAYYDYYTTVRTDYGIIVSSVETSGLDNFAAYMKTVVANHQEDLLGASYGSLLNYFHYGFWNSEIPDMYDMQGVMRQVLDEDGFASWQEEAAKVIKCYHADGWYSAFSRQINPIDDGQCCGVTMFVPLSKYDGSNYRFNESYLDTAWGKYVWQQ